MAQFYTNDIQGKIFQRLLFLIRDWANFDQYKYGYEDSQDYLKNVVLDSKPTHTQDMKELRQYLRDSFESIDCFLMPNPGHEVVDSKDFDGRWVRLDQSFVSCLKTLISTEFAPENLLKKKVFGKEATAEMLYDAIKGFQTILNSPEVLSGRSMYRAFATGHLEILIDSLLNEYKSLIDEKSATVESVEELDKAHNTMVNDLKINYDNTKKIGDEKLHQKYCKKLIKEADEYYNIAIQLKTAIIEMNELDQKAKESEMKNREAFNEDANDKKKALEELELENIRIKEELKQQNLMKERDNATEYSKIKKQKFESLNNEEEMKMMDSKLKENETEVPHVANAKPQNSPDQQEQQMLNRIWEKEKPYVQEEVNDELHKNSVVTDNKLLKTIEENDKKIEKLREEIEKQKHEGMEFKNRVEETIKKVQMLEAKKEKRNFISKSFGKCSSFFKNILR